ncbi:uncharacterized protein LOC107469786 [Arachis duranensis]|uniref:Uncharacterized protein LOC107469786 n=1 Tax=Arachis duranensis TaxID=130453 RepID=A0A6P4BRK8_ARADU|nr:uncharacterized protein LOC107469786 [Arachis duranensis]
MAEEAWKLKSLGEMTNILKQLQLGQQQPSSPPQQYSQQPPQQYSQQLVPQKVCGICSCYFHYTDECPNLQEDNTLVVTHNYYDHPNQGYHQQGGNFNQGYPQQGGSYNQGGGNYNQNWRDNHQQGGRDNNNNGGQKELQTTLASGLTGLTYTLQALLACMDPPSTSAPQAPNSSAIPSQPQPNPKGGINAITLRSETQLKEKKVKDPSPIIITQEEEGIKIKEIEEEEEAQVIVENEETQPTSEVPKNKGAVEEEIAQPIPFPTLVKKARKCMELNPKTVKMFKKVEVTIPLFDVIH